MATNNRERSPAQASNAIDEQSSTLRAHAERCRRLAAATYNREMAESLETMAEDYERTARELSKKAAG